MIHNGTHLRLECLAYVTIFLPAFWQHLKTGHNNIWQLNRLHCVKPVVYNTLLFDVPSCDLKQPWNIHTQLVAAFQSNLTYIQIDINNISSWMGSIKKSCTICAHRYIKKIEGISCFVAHFALWTLYGLCCLKLSGKFWVLMPASTMIQP